MIAAAPSLPTDTNRESMLFPKKRFCFFDQVSTILASKAMPCFLFLIITTKPEPLN